ncbi:MAG: corrinoid protein [Candidatus Omnitrophica bacterium]|nr:corrinoid protein [Candidatus Omnitrophota bacterium]
MTNILDDIRKNLISGNISKVKELTETAISENISAEEVLNKGLIEGMGIVGEAFKKCEIYIPEVLIAAKAMHAGLAILEPILAKSGVEPTGKVVIGTVKGDLHDIGKNLVAMMLKGAGFQIFDLGIDISPEKFVEAANERGAQLIAISSLLTTSMPSMRTAIDILKKSDTRNKIKTIVGGAPVTQGFADEIGADGYAKDAASAVDKAKELLGKL